MEIDTHAMMLTSWQPADKRASAHALLGDWCALDCTHPAGCSSAAHVSNAPSIYPVVVGTAFPPIKPVGVARTVLSPDMTDAHVQPVCVAMTVLLVEHVGVTTVASVTTDATVQPVGVATNVLPGKLVAFCMDCCSCYD
jgi:hypothetical protein